MLGVVNAEKRIVDPQNGGDKDSWRELEIAKRTDTNWK